MLWYQSCFALETAPLCQRTINTRYIEVVEIALVCLNYERMTFRAVALESIAFEVDCSLKVFVPQGGTGLSPKCPSVPKWKWDICLSDWPQSFSAKRHFFTLRLYVCDPWRTLLLIWVLLVFLASAKNEWPCREYPSLWRVQGSWNDSVSWFASLENSGVLIFWNLAVHFEGSLAFMGDISFKCSCTTCFHCVAEFVERPYILQTVTHRQYKKALRQAS